MTKGKYIVIEGADGTGKSTQLELLKQYLLEQNHTVLVVQEPGGDPLSDKLRDVIKDGSLPRDPWTNVMLFTASRRSVWLQAIKPALEAGKWVIAARNYISTVAYQGYGEGVDIQKILDYTKDNVDEAYLSPDKVFVLTLEDESARDSRIGQRPAEHDLDTFESKSDDFQQAMQSGYVKFAAQQGLTTINASQSIEAIQQEIRNQLQL
jgi:dTMP kinase